MYTRAVNDPAVAECSLSEVHCRANGQAEMTRVCTATTTSVIEFINDRYRRMRLSLLSLAPLRRCTVRNIIEVPFFRDDEREGRRGKGGG